MDSCFNLAETHNGKLYFDIKTFAAVTNRSRGSVCNLIAKGNRIRKLACEYFMDKPMIPASELIEFPFTVCGRNSEKTYHYDEFGRVATEAPDATTV
jgi:hypothetical protein